MGLLVKLIEARDSEQPEYDRDLMIEDGRMIFMDGYLYDVFVQVYDDMSIDVTHSPVYYGCWDGKFPF
ncbi:MAG: hypothetical protein CL607_15050 [Anaerolineaceae bacterium]|nr:hypothetical protein [Anaerolineaceae bacterium]